MSLREELLPQTPLPWQAQVWQQLTARHQAGQLAHAYLFAGPPAVGKALLACRLGTLMLCLQPRNSLPCGECRNCQLGGGALHPDIKLVQPEAGARDIKIEQIRALSEFASQTSHSGQAKIMVIDQAQRMNTSAANALLKTLEEPQGKTYLILATDLPGYLPATIRSRCQRVQFAMPELDTAAGWLQTQLGPEQDAMALLVASDGYPLQALELAESGALELRQQFQAQLLELLQCRSAVPALIASAGRLGELQAIGHLLRFSTILVQALTTAREPEQPALLSVYGRLRQRPQPERCVRQLMELYQQAQLARRQLLSGANPNPQLLMEDLLWRWQQFARSL